MATNLPIGIQFFAIFLGVLVLLRILYAFGLFSWWNKGEHTQENNGGEISFRRRYIDQNNLEHYFHYQLSPFQLLWFTVLFSFIIIAAIVLIKGSYDYFFAEFDFPKLKSFFFEVSKWTFIIAGILYIFGTAKIIIPSIFLRDFPYLLGGNRAQGKKDYSKALKYFEKAVKIFPSEYGYYKIGRVKGEIEKKRIDDKEKTDRHFVESYFNEAIEAYSKSLEFDHPYYKTYEERAELRVKMYEYDEAIEDLNKAMQIVSRKSVFWINQKLSIAYKERALCREVLEDRKGAIEDLDKAISLNTNALELLEERAELKYWEQDFKGAINDYFKFIISSRYSEDYAILKLKNIHEALGEYENYVLLIKSIIDKRGKGKSDELIKDLAELMIGRGDTQGATRVYEKSSAIDEDLLEKYMAWEDRFQEGLKKFEEENLSFSYYKKKSKHYKDFGKLDLAFESLSSGFEYIETQKDRLDYYLELGNIYLKTWDYKNAIDAFYQGWEIDTEKQYMVFDHSLALIRKNQTEFTEALDLYQNYIDLRRERGLKIDDYMYIHLIEILTALRKYEDVLDLIKAWDSEDKSWSHYSHYGYKMDKMIDIREKAQTRKIINRYM